MKKKYFIAMLSVLTAQTANADIGLGTSVNSSDTKLYLPYNLSENLRIEPSMSYYRSDYDRNDYSSDFKRYEFSVGLFSSTPIAEKMNFYYGGRVGIVRENYRYSDSLYKRDGYSVSPGLGFEYALTNNFRIAAEADWTYSNVSSNEYGYDYEEKVLGLNSNLIARFYFN